ncbi:hypothetical protein GCM10027586_10860 [Kineococcus gypseus]
MSRGHARRTRRTRAAAARQEPAEQTLSVLSLEWDFGYSSILVDRSPHITGVQEVRPEALGLTAQLCARLHHWHQRQETLSGHWVRQWFEHEPETEPESEESRHLAQQLSDELHQLAWDVQHQLGSDVEVQLHGRALSEHRAHQRAQHRAQDRTQHRPG